MAFVPLFNRWLQKAVPAFMANASIIGADPRVPACGGGTWIDIDGHPNPITSTGYFDIGKLPAGFTIGNTATYPIRVEIDYTVNSFCTMYVDISRIKLMN